MERHMFKNPDVEDVMRSEAFDFLVASMENWNRERNRLNRMETITEIQGFIKEKFAHAKNDFKRTLLGANTIERSSKQGKVGGKFARDDLSSSFANELKVRFNCELIL